MIINKDTKIYGSFSLNAGNNGNLFFNKYFQLYNIDAIYKSFSVNNIEKAVESAKTLNFSGFAISMPFKKEVIKYVDELSDIVKKTNSCNTIINNKGKLIAHNTDYYPILEIIKDYKDIIILGDGGFSSSAQFACELSEKKYKVINRKNWSEIKKLKNKVILNCTPLEKNNIEFDNSNTYLDTLPTSDLGQKMHKILAKEQFYLYTGIKI